MPVCNYCNRSFVDGQGLRMHTESKHQFECTHCDRIFKTSDGRDQHERTKHTFHCSFCNREFRSQESLDQHEEAKHSGYECRYCDKEFTSDGARIQHQNAKHGQHPPTVHPSSYSFSLSSYAQVPAANPAPMEQPSVNVVLDALSTQESVPEASDGEDVLMTQSPMVQVTAPKPVANFACGICGEPVATILALEAHELQHKTNSCACQICERADSPCNCNICMRTSTPTLLVNELLDSVMSGEREETMLPADSLGAIEPKAVGDSLVGSCDLVVAMESQDVTDPSVDRSDPAHAMDSQDEQPSLEQEREVDGERSHDLTLTHTPLPPRYKDNDLDNPTCLSEVALNVTEECSITNLQLGFAPMECDTIPCDLDVLEQVRFVIPFRDYANTLRVSFGRTAFHTRCSRRRTRFNSL
ncbi:hypothetical protein EDB19DRAFT_109315 [Suillus lakei]|nr:hypothetical protein EDB19DRAFT_109315 [Suillus lakei]